MNTKENCSELNWRVRGTIFLAATVLLSAVLAGCASNKSDVVSAPDAGSIGDMIPVWQNAGATAPATTVATATPAPPPPPNTLVSSVVTVGGSVSTKPPYATYEVGWPRIFASTISTNTLYEPQVVSWDGMVLKARAAVSMLTAGMTDPTFGILQIEALTHVDKVERTVHFEDVQITDANFPSAVAKKGEYSTMWLKLLKEDVRSVSLDRISADLAVQGAEKKAQAVPILNPAPAFIFSTKPEMLIQVQGQPVFHAVKDTDVERLLNTRAFIAKVSSGRLYLHL